MPKPIFQLKIHKNTRQHHFPAKLSLLKSGSMSSLKVFLTFFNGSMSWVAWPCHFCLLVITVTATSLLLCQQYQNWYIQAFNTSFSAPWRWAWFIWCGIPYVHNHQYNLIQSSICFVSDCSTLTCHNLLYRTPTWDTESLKHCMRIDNGFAFLGSIYAQHVPHACFQ